MGPPAYRKFGKTTAASTAMTHTATIAKATPATSIATATVTTSALAGLHGSG